VTEPESQQCYAEKDFSVSRAVVVHTFISVLGRQRQADLREASLVYRASSRTARTIQKNPDSKKQKEGGRGRGRGRGRGGRRDRRKKKEKNFTVKVRF
jgi:hypothetical protein